MSATRAFIKSIKSPESPGHTHTGNPVGPDGIVRCYHGQVLNALTSKTIDNPERKFYTCFKGKGDSSNCGFFKWEDDILQREQEAMSHFSAPKLRSTQETPPAASSSNKRYRSSESLCMNQKSVERSRSDVNNNNNEILTDDEPQRKKLRKGTPMTIGSYAEAPKPAAYSIFGKLPNLNATPRRSQWEDIKDDPENPFHDRASALHQTQATPSTPGSPSKGQGLTESLTKVIDELTILNGQVQRLERQRIATEKSRDARSQRITQLEKQVEELLNRNKSLEEELEAFRVRR